MIRTLLKQKLAFRPVSAGSGLVSILDQGLVSGLNFATALGVGRVCGREELGVFSLGFSVLLLTIVAQQSLVARPYTIFSPRLSAPESDRYASHCVMMVLLLSLICSLLIAGTGLLLGLSSLVRLRPTFLVVALVVPGVTLREFARRHGLAHMRARSTLGLDALVCGCQAAGLVALIGWHQLSSETAFICLGASALIGSCVWLLAARRHWAFAAEGWWSACGRHWQLGRWVWASELTLNARSQSLYWLLVGILGFGATGILSACATLIRATNPILLGVMNIGEPLIARAYADRRASEMRRVTRTVTLTMIGLTLPVLVIIVIWGDLLLVRIFGAEYGGHRDTLALLVGATLISTISFPVAAALRALERPAINFSIRAAGLIIVLGLAAVAVPVWGIRGGAAALLAANLISALARWWVYLRLLSDSTVAFSGVESTEGAG